MIKKISGEFNRDVIDQQSRRHVMALQKKGVRFEDVRDDKEDK